MKQVTSSAKPAKRMARAETVDDYLAAVPEEVRAALAKLRKTIKAAAPKATEVISYQIPAYKHHGLLVGFASSSGLCTFHIMSVKVTSAHAAELKGYKLGKASIRFAPDKPLPAALVTRLVKARIAENEAGRSYGGRQ
ncbi:MAG TPA: DUF1801 domain-containing protein [Blastocatellia bacterium]|nr:DUF1801 domain-containing protein [Blastocatellia bacterium]